MTHPLKPLLDRAMRKAGFVPVAVVPAPDKPDAERPAKVRHKLTGGNGHAKAKTGR